jgi:hypothetical protein
VDRIFTSGRIADIGCAASSTRRHIAAPITVSLYGHDVNVTCCDVLPLQSLETPDHAQRHTLAIHCRNVELSDRNACGACVDYR